jgi:DNA-binding MarR family transcriptional regulator
MPILRGQSHPSAKLTDEQVLQIRKLWQMGHRNIKVIARNNKVSPSNVKKIIERKTWVHLNEFWSGSL